VEFFGHSSNVPFFWEPVDLPLNCWLLCSNLFNLLYIKYQWNTRRVFTWKHDIFAYKKKHVISTCVKITVAKVTCTCLLQGKWNGLVFYWCLYNKYHNIAAWGYEISLLVLKNISLVCCAHSTLEETIFISVLPCHILYQIYMHVFIV